MTTAPKLTEVVQILSRSHRPVTCNEYGRPIAAGFTVTDGPDGKARISHTTVQPDLLDPERPSNDELAAARHRMTDAYAKTLEDAGYTVTRRGAQFRPHPYLLASC